MKQALPTQPLLDQIKAQYYDNKQPEKRFYQDRKMLLYALTWPAKWLDQHGLPITPQAYQKLITQRLQAIQTHGQEEEDFRYFPRYLLKCIQDWLAHHGDQLYQELKHVRNQLSSIEKLIQQNNDDTAQNEPQHAHITRMADAHQILKQQVHAKKISKKNQQLELF